MVEGGKEEQVTSKSYEQATSIGFTSTAPDDLDKLQSMSEPDSQLTNDNDKRKTDFGLERCYCAQSLSMRTASGAFDLIQSNYDESAGPQE